MSWILLFIFSSVGIGLFLFGCFVFLSNRASSINRSFGLFTMGVSGWMFANFIGANFKEYEISQYFAVLDFLTGPIMAYLFWLFAYNIYKDITNSETRTLGRIAKVLGVITLLTSILSATKLVVDVSFKDNLNLDYGPLFPVYAAVIASLAVSAIFLIIGARQSARGLRRRQLNSMLLGLTIATLAIATSNVVIPQLTNSKIINLTAGNISYLGLLFFLVIAAYATLRQKLFNVRLIVARSLAYLLLSATLLGLYAALMLSIATWVSGDGPDLQQLIWPIMISLFVAATAAYFRRVFDKVTNKIFYRDAYDPQSFLNELNKTLVGNIEIGILLRHTSQVIENNLKAECHIYVSPTETNGERVFGVSRLDIKPRHLEVIKDELSTIKDKTTVTDELGEHYLELKNALYINNIAVVSSLVTSYATNQEATAYLFLGYKKSGNSYSKQDLKIIDIVTDELLIAIQNALRFEEIQSFNITLQNRINDATIKLKRSNEKLKEMDETKDEFISMASHQLRTPLTSVKGYLSMVLEGDAGKVPESQQQLLNQAYVSAQRMVYLIADLLNVSRLKTGKFVIDRIPTNLADMVESEISQLVEVAKGHKISLNYNKPEDFPILALDETKTRQVVMNFVDNAIYYTPSGGKIKIELRADRSSVYFMVKDNGMGVPKSDQPHLFTKFYRARNAQKARPDGTGLGLFMAKKVITEQGGTILFESEEGKGSIFGFKFDRPKEDIEQQDIDKKA